MNKSLQKMIVLGGLGLSVVIASAILFMASFEPPNDLPAEYIMGTIILMVIVVYALAYSEGLLTQYYTDGEGENY